MLSSLKDEQLMTAYAASNDGAFEILYQRHKGPLFRFFLKSLKKETDAQELFQELWLRIIKYKQSYSDAYKFTTWAYSIAHRQLIDWYRKNSKEKIMDYEQDENQWVDHKLPQPANEFEQKRMAKKVKETIATLPFQQREVFLLRHDAGLSLKQIAVVTDQNEQTIKSQHRYAIIKLRQALEKIR